MTEKKTMGEKVISFITKLGAVVGSVVAVTTVAYGLVIKMGWVIGRAEAQTMITLAVQEAASANQQALLDEQKARQVADYNFQLTLVNDDIAELLNSGPLDAAETDELEQLKKKRDSLNAAISALGQ